jgi:formylglycine-generating enzyme
MSGASSSPEVGGASQAGGSGSQASGGAMSGAGGQSSNGAKGGAENGGVGGTAAGAGGSSEPEESECALGAKPCPLDLPTCSGGKCVVRGPKLVKIGDFYIDSTEVTRGQYLQFVKSFSDGPPVQGEYCSWNDLFSPNDFGDNPATAMLPITDVDWCDADAYCKWANKHLCGSIDRTQKLAPDDLLDPELSQWALACGGPNLVAPASPHANCNDARNAAPWSVSTMTCEGASTGIWDLEGNAGEWIDGCRDNQDGKYNECYFAGGGPELDGSCTTISLGYARASARALIGFRCCSG